MKSTYTDIPNLGSDWEFWFAHTKSLSKNKVSKTKESFYFILNSITSEIDYVSDTIKDVLGYIKEEFTIECLFASIHPDDLSYCRDCEFDGLQVSNNLFFNEHFRYSFHYSYRIKSKNGTFVTIRQQYHAIEVDDYGHMLKTLVLQERITDYESRPADDFKIFDILKNRPINIPSKYKLTKRELEILELVYKGYKSNEISAMLYLSKHTVDTHRKNILTKTSSASVIELINKV